MQNQFKLQNGQSKTFSFKKTKPGGFHGLKGRFSFEGGGRITITKDVNQNDIVDRGDIFVMSRTARASENRLFVSALTTRGQYLVTAKAAEGGRFKMRAAVRDLFKPGKTKTLTVDREVIKEVPVDRIVEVEKIVKEVEVRYELVQPPFVPPTPDTAKVDLLDRSSNAVFNNAAGLYRVENASGTVVDPLTGNRYQPGDSAYTATALRLSQQSGNGLSFDARQTDAVVSGNLKAGLYAPFIVVDGTVAEGISGGKDVFIDFPAANPLGFDNIQRAGNVFKFEDLRGGGDRDFDDVIFTARTSNPQIAFV